MRIRTLPAGMVFLVAVAIASVACSKPTATPTPTPVPTPTPTAIPKPVMTPTPLPSRADPPADDAPHAGFNTEWWYYSGHLSDDEGNWYGFHYVVFQVSLPGGPPANISHLAIVDRKTGEYATDQRGGWAAPQARDIPGFTFDVGGWKMSGYNGKDRLSAAMSDYAIDLVLESRKPAVLHGGTGLVDFGPGAKSYYYSRTNMGIGGEMTVRGRKQRAVGYGWFDHQWGNFTVQELGWDWLALQLDSGEELMISTLHDRSGKPTFSYGTWVKKDGSAQDLKPSQFQVDATGSWTSPTSGATYPMGWRVRAPELDVDVTLTPAIKNAEFDARLTTRIFYWEGDVTISGSHGGRGYVEMVGYAPLNLPATPTR